MGEHAEAAPRQGRDPWAERTNSSLRAITVGPLITGAVFTGCASLFVQAGLKIRLQILRQSCIVIGNYGEAYQRRVHRPADFPAAEISVADEAGQPLPYLR